MPPKQASPRTLGLAQSGTLVLKKPLCSRDEVWKQHVEIEHPRSGASSYGVLLQLMLAKCQ